MRAEIRAPYFVKNVGNDKVGNLSYRFSLFQGVAVRYEGSLLIKFTESQDAWPFHVMVDLLLRHGYPSRVLGRLARVQIARVRWKQFAANQKPQPMARLELVRCVPQSYSGAIDFSRLQ